MNKTLLEQMKEKREAAQAAIDALLESVATETRDLTADEDTEFRAAVEEIHAFDARIAELSDVETRKVAAAAVPAVIGGARVEEPEEYRKGGNVSYFRDLLNVRVGDRDAYERLTRNDRRTNSEMEKRTGVTTIAGAGGEFAPPLWQIDQFIPALRGARPTADLVTNKPLPAGLSVIDVPKFSTGTTVAAQTTQNTAVSDTDPTTTSVAASVKTLAGALVVSRQSIDQSPINMDEVWLGDLAADYAQKLDAAVITALVAGSTAQVYTDASPTSAKVNTQIAQAIGTVHSGRFAPPTAIVMHPVRWGKLLAYVDGSGRPLAVANPLYGPNNVTGIQNAQLASQGFAGTLQGLPVYLDPSIPQNLGTTQDEILVLKADDAWLYEGSPKAEAFPEPNAANLSVILRFYNYYAFALRHAESVVSIGGTGLITTLAYGA